MEKNKLYDIEAIKEKMEGKEILKKTIYVLQNDLNSQEVIKKEWLPLFLKTKKINEFRNQSKRAIEEKGIVETYYLPYIYGTICGTDIYIPNILEIETYDGPQYRNIWKTTAKSEFFDDLTQTRLISFSWEDEVATPEEIELYINVISEEQNYLELIETLAENLSFCKFNRYYPYPPYLPKKISDYLSEQQRTPVETKKRITDYTDIYSSNAETILEIKKQLLLLPEITKEYYEKKLTSILESSPPTTELTIFSDEYAHQLAQKERLFRLLADINVQDLTGRKYQPELLKQYIEKLKTQVNQKKNPSEQEEIAKNVFFIINYLELNRKKESFEKYQELQTEIVEILTDTLVFQEEIRENILTELTPLYQRAIYLNLHEKLEQKIKESDQEEVALIAYPILLDSTMEEKEFIRETLKILSPATNKALEKSNKKPTT